MAQMMTFAAVSRSTKNSLAMKRSIAELHEHLNTLSGPPRQKGRYRVIEQGDDPARWLWLNTEPTSATCTSEEATCSH